MRYAASIVLLTGLVGSVLCGDHNPPPIITQIVVEGNKVTREHIILRELSHPVGVPFDSIRALRDRNRLYNLGIFESVEVYPRPTASGEAALVVEVVETVRMVPVPVLYYLEDLEDWAYGGGIAYLNFRGLNQRLSLMATFGAETAYNFNFSDPWFAGNEIGIKGWISRTYRGHPVYSLRTEVRDLDVTVMKSYFKKTLQVSAAFSIERRMFHWHGDVNYSLAKYIQEPPHTVFQTRFDVYWRSIDVWRDPTRGIRLHVHVSPVWGLDEDSPTYARFLVQGAWFYPLLARDRPLVLGVSGAVSHYTRRVHPYLYQYVGSSWVRGYELDPYSKLNPSQLQDRLEATSIAGASLELRQTLIPRQLWYSLELGMGMVLFLDAGWGYDPDHALSLAQPIVGYGVGLRFFIPIVQVIAVDFGLNPYQMRVHTRFRLSHSF